MRPLFRENEESGATAGAREFATFCSLPDRQRQRDAAVIVTNFASPGVFFRQWSRRVTHCRTLLVPQCHRHRCLCSGANSASSFRVIRFARTSGDELTSGLALYLSSSPVHPHPRQFYQTRARVLPQRLSAHVIWLPIFFFFVQLLLLSASLLPSCFTSLTIS